MLEYIGDCNLPLSFIETVLKSSLKTNLTPKFVDSKRIDEGEGFKSVIAQLHLQWPVDVTASLPSSVVVKLPTQHKANAEVERIRSESDTKITSIDDYLIAGHNAECQFYRYVADHLTCEYNVPLGHIYHAKMYQSTNEDPQDQFGLIVMEDFVERGRTPHFGSEQLSYAQVESIIRSIASIHAYCIVKPNWNEAKVFEQLDVDKYASFAAVAKNSLLSLRNKYPSCLTASDAEITLISEICKHVRITNDQPQVLVHGDLWGNNLIFAKGESNRLSKELLAIIDWQACHQGGIGEDFARLMTSSVDPHVRRANFHRWLELYYKLLKEKLPKGYKIPFSFDVVLREYTEALGLATFILAVHIGTLLDNQYDKCTEQDKINLTVRLQMSIDDVVADSKEYQRP